MIELDRPAFTAGQALLNASHRCFLQSPNLLHSALLGIPLLFPATVLAQIRDERPQQTPLSRVDEFPAEAVGDVPEVVSRLSFSAGSTFTTEYWFRGHLQEDQGVIAQPYGEVGIGLLESTDERHRLDATLGIWNSIHSEKTGATGDSPSTWYESDVYGMLTFTAGNFDLGAIYTFYTYPNGAASTIQELGLYSGYRWDVRGDANHDDDLDLWIGLGGGVYIETRDREGGEHTYAEINIEPGMQFTVGDDLPLTVSFPVALGFSIDDYYLDAAGDEEVFGYTSAAVAVGVPLPVSGSYGEWTLTGTVTGIFLNAESLKAVEGAEDADLFGSVTIDIEF